MLEIQAEELGGIVVLRLTGRIVRGAETAILRGAVFSRAEASGVALDLSRVDMIDAGGLGVLLEMREWTRANGRVFKLINPIKLVHRLFAITRLDSVFELSFQRPRLSSASRCAPAAVVPAPLQSAETRPLAELQD